VELVTKQKKMQKKWEKVQRGKYGNKWAENTGKKEGT